MIKVTPSSGNVFADIGLPDADRLLEESRKRIQISEELGEMLSRLYLYNILTDWQLKLARRKLADFMSQGGEFYT